MMNDKKNCSICKQLKLLEFFNKNSNRIDGLQTMCKDCSSLRSKNYYFLNKEKVKNKTSVRKTAVRISRREYIFDFLKNHPCVDCGEDDPIVLEFDHLRDKIDNISKMISSGTDLKILNEEILKCEVRCSNCHKRKTAKDYNWYKLQLSLKL